MLLPPGAAGFGLHCFNLRLDEVLVDGERAEHALRQYPACALPEPTLAALGAGAEPLRTVADEAYSAHLRQAQLEQAPELSVTLPPAVLERKQQHQQQQQQAAAAAAAAAAAEKANGGGGAAVSEGAIARSTPPPSNKQQQAAAAVSAGTPPPSQQQQQPAASQATAATASPLPQARGSGGATATAAAPTEHIVSIRFAKDRRDAAAVAAGGFLVAAPPLRRARALFPCVDGPVYYEPGVPLVAPHPFELSLTVGPSDVAVASGALLQQTRAVAPAPGGGPPRAVARTFRYAVAAPALPQHLVFAVGPFEMLPAADLFAVGGAGGGAQSAAVNAAIAGPPLVTAFYPAADADADADADRASDAAEALNNASGGPGGAKANAAAAAPGPSRAAVARALRPLALILKHCERAAGCRFPFAHLQVAVVPAAAAREPVAAGLGCLLVSADLIAPEGCLEPAMDAVAALAAAVARQFFGVLMLPPVRVRGGWAECCGEVQVKADSGRSFIVIILLIRPLHTQYFSKKAPEDAWLQDGLAGWLEAAALRALLGANEVAYRRWQERLALAAVDDGVRLAPLSQAPGGASAGADKKKGGGGGEGGGDDDDAKRGYQGAPVNRDTAGGWGLTYGTDGLEPWRARAWKAAAVVAMAERRVGDGGDEFRRMVERAVLAARASGAGASGGAEGSGAAASAAGDALKARLSLTTAWFVKNLRRKAEGSAAAAKEDASAFRARWVAGAGVPTLRAAYAYDRREGQLLLALRQGGSMQTLKAALRSRARAESLKVAVRELGGDAEWPVTLGADEALKLQRLDVSLDRGAVKRGPGRRPKEPKGVRCGRLFLLRLFARGPFACCSGCPSPPSS